MAFIPVPNGVQLCFDFTTAGQNWQFCLHLRKSTGAPTPTDLQNVADAAASWWTTDFKPNLSSTTTLRQTRATDVSVQGGTVAVNGINTAGTDGAVPVPINAALCVSQRTAKRGRSYRGRAYVSGFDTSVIGNPTDSVIADATALSTDFATLQATLDAISFDVVVATKQHNGAVVNPAETNEVIAFITDQHFDSQRRRLFGRGN